MVLLPVAALLVRQATIFRTICVKLVQLVALLALQIPPALFASPHLPCHLAAATAMRLSTFIETDWFANFAALSYTAVVSVQQQLVPQLPVISVTMDSISPQMANVILVSPRALHVPTQHFVLYVLQATLLGSTKIVIVGLPALLAILFDLIVPVVRSRVLGYLHDVIAVQLDFTLTQHQINVWHVPVAVQLVGLEEYALVAP